MATTENTVWIAMSRDKPPSERWPLCPICKERHPGVAHIWPKKQKKPK